MVHTEICRWVSHGRSLISAIIPVQAPIWDLKLAARGYQITGSHCQVAVCCVYNSAVVKAILCTKMDQPESLLPSFSSVCHMQYVMLVLQTKNIANEILDRMHPDVMGLTVMYESSVGFAPQDFCMVGNCMEDHYMEHLTKLQKCLI